MSAFESDARKFGWMSLVHVVRINNANENKSTIKNYTPVNLSQVIIQARATWGDRNAAMTRYQMIFQSQQLILPTKKLIVYISTTGLDLLWLRSALKVYLTRHLLKRYLIKSVLDSSSVINFPSWFLSRNLLAIGYLDRIVCWSRADQSYLFVQLVNLSVVFLAISGKTSDKLLLFSIL